ncbi:hypothetical protein Gotur_007027 [Gossypium turneri]
MSTSGNIEDNNKCSTDSSNTRKAHFKDKGVDSEPVEDGGEIFDFVKEDFTKFPAVAFSDRVHQYLLKDMKTMIVVKFLGWSIGYATLQNRVSSLWRPSKPFQLMDVENGYFFRKISEERRL